MGGCVHLIRRQRKSLSPAVRGGLFYLGFWGIIGVYAPFLNVYFVRLGLSGRQLGLLATLYPLMTMVVAPMLSAVADRRGWRVPLLALGVAGMVVALVLLRLPKTFVLLLPLMAFLALVRSPISPVADSLIARMAVRHRLDYGRLRVWGSISFAIIALACGAIWEWVGYAPMFLTAAVLFVP